MSVLSAGEPELSTSKFNEKIHVALVDCIPEVQQSFFSISVAIALLAIIVMGDSHEVGDLPSVPSWMVRISQLSDPSYLQIGSAMLVTIIVMRYRYHGDSMLFNLRRRKVSLAATFALVALPIVAISVMEQYWFKPGFGYTRPVSFKEHSFLSSFLGWNADSSQSSCPSGFMLRQTWLTLIGFSFARSTLPNTPGRYGFNWDRTSAAILGLVLGLSVLITINSIAERAHAPFDIAMGISVGTYVFWLCYSIVATVRGTDGRLLNLDIFAISWVFLPIFFFYSRNLSRLGIPAILMLVTTGLAQTYANRRHRDRILPGTNEHK